MTPRAVESVGAALQRIVDVAVAEQDVPGVVAAIADADGERVAVAGTRAIGGAAMTRDTVFRIASVTKPVVAAATLVLVERGALRLDDPVARWMPELASPRVLRDPAGDLDDTVPARSPILVEHLLALEGGLGIPHDFGTPFAQALFAAGQGPPDPASLPSSDEWLARVAALPLLHEPGEGWSYNTGLDLAGVLLERVTGERLGAVLEATVLGPLGMRDTGFRLRPEQLPRTATSYREADGRLVEVDAPDGAWAREVRFESGAGGLVSTVDDLLALGRMLARSGGPRVLSDASLDQLVRPRTGSTPDDVFLGGQSWALGGAVDTALVEPWHVLGRYGWVGGTGTALYAYPDGRVAVWLSQRELGGPDDDARLAPLLTLAAGGVSVDVTSRPDGDDRIGPSSSR